MTLPSRAMRATGPSNSITLVSGNYAVNVTPALAAGAGTPAFRYDPATGDVTFYAGSATNLADLHLLSKSGLFLPDNSSFSGFATKTPGELEKVLLGSSFTGVYDLGKIVPAGLSIAAARSDVTVRYGVSGGGVEQAAALVPEPARSPLRGSSFWSPAAQTSDLISPLPKMSRCRFWEAGTARLRP